ncbi:MAG: hypothetical protein J3Q66DRAFT_400158 [Benniella sp.]|nr:MAG: hypothetical protein J3Q66DRAFT_400158 [Benniella sp.]
MDVIGSEEDAAALFNRNTTSLYVGALPIRGEVVKDVLINQRDGPDEHILGMLRQIFDRPDVKYNEAISIGTADVSQEARTLNIVSNPGHSQEQVNTGRPRHQIKTINKGALIFSQIVKHGSSILVDTVCFAMTDPELFDNPASTRQLHLGWRFIETEQEKLTHLHHEPARDSQVLSKDKVYVAVTRFDPQPEVLEQPPQQQLRPYYFEQVHHAHEKYKRGLERLLQAHQVQELLQQQIAGLEQERARQQQLQQKRSVKQWTNISTNLTTHTMYQQKENRGSRHPKLCNFSSLNAQGTEKLRMQLPEYRR